MKIGQNHLLSVRLMLTGIVISVLITAASWAPYRASTLSYVASSTVTFDFDAGSPTLMVRQNTPFDQTVSGVTAHFSSPSDPAAFSIQNHDTTLFTLSQFSGNYLYDNTPFKAALHIKFSQQLTSLTLTFATIDYHDPGAGGNPSDIKLTAYMNSTTGAPVGSVTTHGTVSTDSYPQGTLSFSAAGQLFNLVVIELPYLPQGATDFLVDNVTVTATLDTTPPVTAVSLSGTTGSQGWYISNVTASLSATDDMSGVAKTEYGFDNTTWTLYTAPLIIAREGTTTLYFRSIDMASNVEAAKMQTMKIDKTKPIANAGSDRTVNTDEAVTFDAAASSDNIGIVNYRWNCGDGTTHTDKVVTHTYSNPGTYTVTLTVEDAAGNTATQAITVKVTLPLWRQTWFIGSVGVAAVAAVAVTIFLLKKRAA